MRTRITCNFGAHVKYLRLFLALSFLLTSSAKAAFDIPLVFETSNFIPELRDKMLGKNLCLPIDLQKEYKYSRSPLFLERVRKEIIRAVESDAFVCFFEYYGNSPTHQELLDLVNPSNAIRLIKTTDSGASALKKLFERYKLCQPKEICVCGVYMECCVLQTAAGLCDLHLGDRVTLASHACVSKYGDDYAKKLICQTMELKKHRQFLWELRFDYETRIGDYIKLKVSDHQMTTHEFLDENDMEGLKAYLESEVPYGIDWIFMGRILVHHFTRSRDATALREFRDQAQSENKLILLSEIDHALELLD